MDYNSSHNYISGGCTQCASAVTPDTYYFINNNSGKALNLSYNNDANKTNIDLYKFTEGEPAQKMVVFAYNSTKKIYKIRPISSKRLVQPFGNYGVTNSGDNVNLYDDVNDITQWWYFEKVSGGYVIRNAANTNCVLTDSGGNAIVSTYTGAKNQIWTLKSATLCTSHTYGSWTTVKNATCTTEGSKKRTCSKCGHVETATIAKTSHSYGSWVTTKAATCETAGTQTRTCSVCGAKETKTIAALGHNAVSANNGKAATCTASGKQSDTKCSRCGKILSTGAVIPATGHSYGSWTTTKQPTCNAEGTKKRTCSICGNVETATIAKTTHNYGSWTTTKQPTCNAEGTKKRTCSICGNVETATIAKTTHSYGSWTTTKKATCCEEGSKKRTCSICGNVETATIAKTTHNYGSATYTWASDYDTCKASHKCLTCGSTQSETRTTFVSTTAATYFAAGKYVYTAYFDNPAFATQTKTVTIAKKTLAKPSTIRLTTSNDSTLIVSWMKVAAATGYKVESYNYSTNKWTVVKTVTGANNVSTIITGLKAGTQYKYRVRAYVTSGSNTAYSAYTAAVSAYTNPARPANIKVSAKTATTVTLKWDRNSNANGYVVQQYKNGSWVTVATINSNATTSYKITGLAKNTSYNFRVRSYKTINGSRQYSSFSNITGKTNK